MKSARSNGLLFCTCIVDAAVSDVGVGVSVVVDKWLNVQRLRVSLAQFHSFLTHNFGAVTMERLKAVRAGHRGAVTRLINKTDEKLENNDINNQKLAAAVENLERKQSVLQELDGQILDSTELPDVQQEIMDTDDYNLQMEETISRYKDIISSSKVSTPQATVSDFSNYSQPQTSNVESSHNTNQNTNTTHSQPIMENTFDPHPTQRFFHRLPTLDLPTYSGDVLLWQTFWESFESTVHSNPALTNIQKFNYLKSQLRDDAERCISGLSLTHANYDQAIFLLRDRFGQHSKIIDAHMQKLIDLPSPTLSLSSLRIFYDKIETSIRGLESLGQRQDTYGSLLTPIIFRKLPSELRKTLTREHGGYSWDINALRLAIGKELQVQEAGQTDVLENCTPTASFVTKATPKPNSRNTGNHYKKTAGNSSIRSCVFCDQQHLSMECTKVCDRETRFAIVKKKQLCYNCLGKHKAADCRSRYKCRKCDKKHHTSLCDKDNKPVEQAKPVNQVNSNALNAVSSAEQENATSTSSFHTSSPPVQFHTEILLKTAISPVWYGNHSMSANILLDEGSQKSFISQDLANQLQVRSNGTATISLAAFGDSSHNIRHMEKATIHLETQNGGKLPMDVLIVPKIAAPLQNVANVEAAKLPYLHGLKLAHHVTQDDKFEINLLIGADYYWAIVQDKVIRGPGPTAVKSRLGYLLSGPLNRCSNEPNSASMLNVLIDHKIEEHDIERFWKLESMGVALVENSKETTSFYDTYQESCITYKDNKYCAKLPWKEDCPELPTNRNIVKRRTERVISRLEKEPEMLKAYTEIIKDQEKRGYIERVPEESESVNRAHYIPHHAVRKDSVTTPIRIVYDCSCRESQESASLNDCLMSVTPVLYDLTGILTRFRLHRYAISTDIEKAFLQIELDEEDRDMTRFFWLSDPMDTSSPLITYRFKAILFGTTCSPVILNATMLKHLKTHPSNTTEKLKQDIYVDNVLSSFAEEDELLSFYQESRNVMSEGGFNLRSWSSNNVKLQNLAKSENCLDSDNLIKILGLRWDVNSDNILFQNNISDSEELLTKRIILQQSSRIFDPLGLLSPITVRAKLLMQTLWERKFDWDSHLPDDMQLEWRKLVQDLQDAVKLKFPRYYFTSEKEDSGDRTLHIFTDASMRAYGACAYITTGNQSALVMARNRVAPLKQVTLPRLELMGAVVGIRLAKH